MKQNDKNIEKISKKVTFAFLIFILINVLIILISKPNRETLLETIYYSSQITSSLFVVGGVLIALWQYFQQKSISKRDVELIQVQQAIDLAAFYKNNIISKYPAIKYVFKESGVMDILNKARQDQLKNFTVRELKTIFSEKDIQELKNIQKSDKFFEAIQRANIIYNLNLHTDEKNDINTNKEIAIAFMANMLTETANNLEYFALHFRHNTADESSIYQSIHKSYLEIVQTLYYYMSNSNIDASDKVYTNVSWLYNNWYTTKKKQDSLQNEHEKEVVSSGTVIED